MNNTLILRKTLLAASIATLVACSGGSDNLTTADTSSSTGVITGFGSIYINGVEYETDAASVNVDGVPSDERNLGVGDVCVIEGTVNADGVNGTAVSVKCADELEGYVNDVSGLTSDVGIIVVMGQSVTVTLDTVFEGNGSTILTVADLSVNDVVEVSGFSDGNGTVFATRIETKDASEDAVEVEVKGIVSMLNEAAMSFMIGELTVDYSSVSSLPTLVDGLLVEVETDTALTGDVATGFTMSASEIEIEEDGDKEIDGDEGDEIKMQGLVSGIDLEAGTFLFNGHLVDVSTLDDDFDSSLLVEGSMITVEGYIDADGQFLIEEIEDEKETEDEVEGIVSGVSAEDSTVTITVTVDGVETTSTYTVNNSTRMIDEMDGSDKYFNLEEVNIDDAVEIEFYVEDGINIATELERDDVEMEDVVIQPVAEVVLDTQV